ncbi:hypothetical protein B566_EDAN014912 [Ephemera danica]|nr:hypothetical protein B566_EDAN014912 [Ephemera danica]
MLYLHQAWRWVQGVPEGPGRMEWPTGRVYEGNFHAGHMQGHGRQTYQDGRSYEGQWTESLQSGYGVEKLYSFSYASRSAAGDVYEGYFLRGLPHGHGVCKEGGFLSSAASVYVGEWASGRRHGYGVSDEISTGEKYLGLWSNDMKHGCGMVVTLDGIYYEGNFTNSTLTGKGVMVWEDGSFYEGEFGAAGVFAGKGRLLLSSGDQFEGTLHGAWNEGVKISGTFNKSMSPPPTQTPPKPGLFGRLSVLAAEKWRPVFRECLRQLGIPGGEETGWEPGGINTARAWEGIAVALSQKQGNSGSSSNLDTIPQYGRVTLDAETYHLIKIYLTKAFEERAHPLGLLMHQLSGAYTTTYGGVRVHPVLLAPAVAELISLSTRLYQMVRLLFPALPPPGHETPLPPKPSPSMPDISKHEKQHATRPRALSDTQGDIEVASAAGLLLPLLLPRVHSALFVLYALHNKAQDDEYWRKLLKWNKQRNISLMAFLGIERRFWPEEETEASNCDQHMFGEAVETLQQLKTTFAPLEKLMVIRTTFQHMTKAVQRRVGSDFLWTMDALLPVFQFVVIRAQILQLGSEIHFVEDFMEPHLLNGELGIMFTTLKACYYQILQERIN